MLNGPAPPIVDGLAWMGEGGAALFSSIAIVTRMQLVFRALAPSDTSLYLGFVQACSGAPSADDLRQAAVRKSSCDRSGAP